MRFLVMAMASAGVSLVIHAAHAQVIDWQIDITPAGDLFPALQLSQTQHATTAAIGAGDGLVSVRIQPCEKAAQRGSATCPTTPHRVHLRIDTPGLRQPALVEAMRDPTKLLVLHPRLDWDLAALRSLRVVRQQRMQFALEGEARTIEVRLHPLDDALYFVREGGDSVDLGWAFAGYVNPHAAVVDDVLALAHSIDPGFATTKSDPTTNLRRVATVWAALEKHGMRYASDNPALSQGPQIYSQRVRLPGEAWRERRANCIDSSVLIASVLERLGLRTYIVLVPGHAFLRFDTSRDGRGARYLETTVLGATSRQHGVGARDNADPGAAVNHFTAALAAGEAHWRRVASRLDGHHGPDYALIDIETARTYGIIPLVVDRDDADRASGHIGDLSALRQSPAMAIERPLGRPFDSPDPYRHNADAARGVRRHPSCRWASALSTQTNNGPP